jgi:hypothetical protein
VKDTLGQHLVESIQSFTQSEGEINGRVNAKRQTPNAKRQTPNAKRQTPNAKRQTPNAERRTRKRPASVAMRSPFLSAPFPCRPYSRGAKCGAHESH